MRALTTCRGGKQTLEGTIYADYPTNLTGYTTVTLNTRNEFKILYLKHYY